MHIGLVGFGKMGRRHLEAYRSLDCHITIYDVDLANLEQETRIQDVEYVNTLNDLLAIPSIEAIDICTPTASHTEIILRSLDAGKHVLCEKPLHMTEMDSLAIKKAQRKTNTVLMIGYIYRYAPVYQFVHQIVTAGVIGQPRLAIFRIGGRGSHASWKHKRSEFGGAKYEMLVHMLDLVHWLFGLGDQTDMLWQTTINGERVIQGQIVVSDTEDFVLVRLNVQGAEIICEADMSSTTFINYVDIQGSNGSIFASVLSTLPTIVSCTKSLGNFQAGTHSYTFSESNFLQAEIEHFLKVVNSEEQQNYHTVDDSIAIMHILNQLE